MGYQGARPQPKRCPKGRSAVAGGLFAVESSCQVLCGRLATQHAKATAGSEEQPHAKGSDDLHSSWGWSSYAFALDLTKEQLTIS
jgi:hypothetical protein